MDRHVEGQGWVIKELKDEMKDVKDVLTVAVGHIQELETVEQSRILSRVTQPLSPDRLVGMESSSLSRFNLAFCPEQLSHCLRTGK